MRPISEQPRLIFVQPAFVLGGLIALYFLIGRWNFARLASNYDTVTLFEQPRFWVLGVIAILAGLVFCSLRDRGLSRLRAVDVALLSWMTYMLISATWAPDTELATEKAIEVGMLITAAVAIALIRSPATEGDAMLGFWYALVMMGAAMGLLALYMSTGGRTFAPTGGPNIFGRNMGLVGVGAILLSTRSSTAAKLSLSIVVVLSAIWVVMCGSRGALLASGVAGLVLILTAQARLVTKAIAVIGFCVVGSVALLHTELGQTALEVFSHRILEQTVEKRYTASRDSLFSSAVELGLERPVAGWGLSGFRSHSWTYPHNLFLETFAEGGLIGVSLLLFVFWTWWRTLRSNRQAFSGTTLASLALVVTAASFSGNIYDSRGVFVLLALSIEALPSPQCGSLRRSDGYEHSTKSASGAYPSIDGLTVASR